MTTTFLRVCQCGRVKKHDRDWILIEMTASNFFSQLVRAKVKEVEFLVEDCPFCKKNQRD